MSRTLNVSQEKKSKECQCNYKWLIIISLQWGRKNFRIELHMLIDFTLFRRTNYPLFPIRSILIGMIIIVI